MWEQYEPPGERAEKPSSATDPGLTPTDPGLTPTGNAQPIVAGGTRPRSGSGNGLVVGLVASLAIIGGIVGVARSAEPEPDYSGFYECVAEQEAGDSGLLSPAELCQIGHDRPPDYVDDHEFDLFGDREDQFGY